MRVGKICNSVGLTPDMLEGVNLVFGNTNTPDYFGLRISPAIMAEGSRILTYDANNISIFFLRMK